VQCLESRYFSLCLTIVIYVSDGFSERMLRILCVLCCFVVFSVAVLCCAGHIISHNESPFFNKPDLVLLVACSASVASARVKVHLEYSFAQPPTLRHWMSIASDGLVIAYARKLAAPR